MVYEMRMLIIHVITRMISMHTLQSRSDQQTHLNNQQTHNKGQTLGRLGSGSGGVSCVRAIVLHLSRDRSEHT